MPTIAATPFLIGKSILTIEADDYTSAISSAEGVPAQNVATHRDIGGGVVNVYGDPSWTLNVGAVQDWTEDTSFVHYLRLNAGQKKTAKLTPVDGGRGVEVTILCQPTGFGGAAGTVASTTITLQVDGQPVWDDAA